MMNFGWRWRSKKCSVTRWNDWLIGCRIAWVNNAGSFRLFVIFYHVFYNFLSFLSIKFAEEVEERYGLENLPRPTGKWFSLWVAQHKSSTSELVSRSSPCRFPCPKFRIGANQSSTVTTVLWLINSVHPPILRNPAPFSGVKKIEGANLWTKEEPNGDSFSLSSSHGWSNRKKKKDMCLNLRRIGHERTSVSGRETDLWSMRQSKADIFYIYEGGKWQKDKRTTIDAASLRPIL